MVKWGIIGAGNIAHRFAASLKNEKDATLYAISGRNRDKLKAFQEEYPCEKIFVGHEHLLLDAEVDAVYIALPHHMHCRWVIKALQAHKAVLCEKPAVLNEAEMIEIAKVAKQNQTLFMEAMKSRFEPAYVKVKELLQQQVLGQIQSIYVENCFVLPQESIGKTYHTQKGVGGCLLDSGCYCVNWVNDFFEEEPVIEKVYANVRDSIDYYVDAKMKFGNCLGEIVCAFDRKTKSHATIVGEKGKMIVDNPHRPTTIHLFVNEKEETLDFPYEHDDFFGQIHHFNTLVKEHIIESDVMPLEASIRNARIMDMIHENVFDYADSDLKILEQQEQALAYDSFEEKDAQELGNEVLRLLPEYDRGIAIRIVREQDAMVLFQSISPEKNEKNIMYAEGKHCAIKKYGHSSAWYSVAAQLGKCPLEEGILPSGGAFPIYSKRGKLIASILVSGLHEGKDHELMVRAISNITKQAYPDFIKAMR